MKTITCAKISAAVLALLGTASLSSASPSAKEAEGATHTPFVTAILRNFDAWDANHDGTLSTEEINHEVVDPAVKGDDAAAVATLKLLSRSKKNTLPPLTKAYFLEYDKAALAIVGHHQASKEHAADAENQTIDTVASASTTQPAARSGRLPVDFDLYYTASKERIAKGGPEAFTGRFVIEDTRQGPLGDCFFVASISTLAYHDPERFQKMIVPLKSGEYQVNLPNTAPILVPKPTDAELAISSTTAGDGTWLAIMEQAFGKFKAREKGANSDDVEGTEILRTGGDSAPTIKALTGHTSERFAFGKTVEFRKENAEKMLPKVREALTKAVADHRMITAGGMVRTRPDAAATGKEAGTPTPIPPDLLANHVYAILNYDAKTDVVEFWNPHGEHFAPKGPAGLENGYPTEHGRFKVPLTEAYQFFGSFTIEQDTAAKQ